MKKLNITNVQKKLLVIFGTVLIVNVFWFGAQAESDATNTDDQTVMVEKPKKNNILTKLNEKSVTNVKAMEVEVDKAQLQTPEEKALAKIPKHPVTVISHRGTPKQNPEHSFAGYDQAIKDGSQYIEQDLVTTADKQLVVFHDKTLRRLFGVNTFIEAANYNYLSQYKYPNGEKIHTLPEIFDRYKDKTNYVIETRNNVSDYAAYSPSNFVQEDLLTQQINQYHLEKNIILQSFSLASLNYLAQTFPEMPKIYLIGNKKTAYTSSELQNVDSVALGYFNINPNLIDYYHQMGKKVYVFLSSDMNFIHVKQILTYHDLDGIFTDYTKETIELLKAQGRY